MWVDDERLDEWWFDMNSLKIVLAKMATGHDTKWETQQEQNKARSPRLTGIDADNKTHEDVTRTRAPRPLPCTQGQRRTRDRVHCTCACTYTCCRKWRKSTCRLPEHRPSNSGKEQTCLKWGLFSRTPPQPCNHGKTAAIPAGTTAHKISVASDGTLADKYKMPRRMPAVFHWHLKPQIYTRPTNKLANRKNGSIAI